MLRPLWLLLVAALGGCAVAPSPIDDVELAGLTGENLRAITRDNEPVAGALTIYEALARALKYNLDGRVEAYQAMLRTNETQLATAKLLPNLVAQSAYSARNNDIATAKLDLPTGIEAPPLTVSNERTYSNGDATLGWNVVDFALSYARARQSADLQLIAIEGRRKAVQRIFEDVRAAYWRAASSQRLAHRFARLESKARQAIRYMRSASASGVEAPMTALTYERELVQILQTAERLRHELLLAKSQLAALINLPPGSRFSLIDRIEQPDPAVDHLALEDLFAEAVFNRPEIRDVAYRQRINEHEAVAAVTELLPEIVISGSASFNDDRFLLHSNWVGWGTSVAGNLLRVAQIPARLETVDANSDLLRQKALAVTAAVMTQVMISRVRQRNSLGQLATAREYRDVQATLVSVLGAERGAGMIGEQTLIREEMNLLIAEAQHDIAAGGMLSSNSALMTSLGYDLQGLDIKLDRDIRTIASDIKANWSVRSAVSERGRYLAELEAARREAERRRIEAERKRAAEAKRLADLAVKAAAEERRAQKLEAERIRREAELERLERQRERDEERRARRAEIKRAAADAKIVADRERRERQLEATRLRREADAARRAAKRARAAARQARISEARRNAAEARRAAAEAQRERRGEAARLKAEAARARHAAKQRSYRIKSRRELAAPVRSTPVWEWVWPMSDNRETGSLKDSLRKSRRTTR